jgi:hypothetical protein
MLNLALVRAVIIALLAIVFGLVVFFGIQSGIKRAQSNYVYHTTETLKEAIGYFKNDHNRYPSEVEFASGNGFEAYLSPFPPHEFASGDCADSFSYRFINQRQYDLTFCLPSSVEGLTAGRHTIAQ